MRESDLLFRAFRWLDGRGRHALNRLRMLRVEPGAWLADRARRSLYPTLVDRELRESVRSETCFIFGSGQSLDEITPEEWGAISQHNTIGFNYFIRSRFVRVDFHVVGEMGSSDDLTPAVWRPVVREYARLIEENPFYQQTVLGLQEGLAALQSNRLASSGGIRPGRRVFRYRRIARGRLRPPTSSLAEGLVHGAGTVVGCVNLAVILGFREIVLAGVDLYDRRVFSALERRPSSSAGSPLAADVDQPHRTADNVVEYLGSWGPQLAARGVTLSVYNPRSLLARVLAVRARVR